MLKCRLQVRVGYAFFHATILPQKWEQFLHNLALAGCLFYIEKKHKKGFCAYILGLSQEENKL